MRGSLTSLLIIIVLSFGVFTEVKGQSGTLEGTVTDRQDGEPLPGVNVIVEREGRQVSGTTTGIEGEFRMGNLQPGNYTLKASYIGYEPVEIRNIQIRPDAIVREEFTMLETDVDLPDVEVIERRRPLIEVDEGTTGGTIDRQDIENLPTRSLNQMAALTGGTYSQDGGTPNIRGQRSDGTIYYVDGVRVRGLQGVPQSAIEQVNTQIGGLSARYGDATGGVISVTTRSASDHFTGGVEAISSQFLDPYGYNTLDAHVTGPLFKSDRGGEDEETVVGFFLAGEFGYRGDYSPQGFGIHTVSDDVKDDLLEDPIQPDPEGAGFLPRAELITADQIDEVRRRPNSEQLNYSVSGRLDFNLTDDITLQAGGQHSHRHRDLFSYSFSMFAPEQTPVHDFTTYRGYARINHRIPIDQDEESRFEIQDAYYNIHFDFTRNEISQYHPDHEDNFFRYGHLGQYDIYREPTYVYEERTHDGVSREAYYQEGTRDTMVDFSPSGFNSASANYTTSYYERLAERGQTPINMTQIQQQNALRNGDQPPLIYSIWRSPGTFWPSYQEQDQNEFNLNARGAVTIEGHELSFGVQHEQRFSRFYAISASALWDNMRQRVNQQFDGLDTDNPQFVRDENGVFQDTVRYPRNINPDDQTNFDKNFREHLIAQGRTDEYGNPIDEQTMLNPDRYDPDEDFSIDMFAPEELYGGGSSPIINNTGYDHQGNRLTGSDANVSFFDDDGNVEFLQSGRIEPYSPIYSAAYIQDKFSYRDLIFNVGLRLDRYDANQQVLSDPYSLYPVRTVNEVPADDFADFEHPSNIGGDYKVYGNHTENPTAIVGYRDGSQWYDHAGNELDDPSVLADAAGGEIQPYLAPNEDPDAGPETLRPESFKDFEVVYNLLPRISFSFPISERSSFHANYDVLTQRPRGRANASIFDYYYLENRATLSNNNPALKPERRINYELGFQQRVGANSALRIQAFYGEIRDLVQITEFTGAYPISYRSFDNIDFGTVKGMTLGYEYRPFDANFRMRMNYTLQFADGTGSSQTTQAALVQVGQPNLRTPMPLDFDVRHNIVTNFDYRFGTGENYNGPVTDGGFEILGNTGLNVILNARSGEPYSRQGNVTQEVSLGVAGRRSLEGQLNSARLPWTFSADLRINRRIPLTFGGTEDEDGVRDAPREYGLNVYLWVQNVFDTRNIRNVYQFTGSPDDDGWLSHPEGINATQNATSPEAYRDQYSMKANNPGNFLSPRTIRLGAAFNF